MNDDTFDSDANEGCGGLDRGSREKARGRVGIPYPDFFFCYRKKHHADIYICIGLSRGGREGGMVAGDGVGGVKVTQKRRKREWM